MVKKIKKSIHLCIRVSNFYPLQLPPMFLLSNYMQTDGPLEHQNWTLPFHLSISGMKQLHKRFKSSSVSMNLQINLGDGFWVDSEFSMLESLLDFLLPCILTHTTHSHTHTTQILVQWTRHLYRASLVVYVDRVMPGHWATVD